MIVVTAASGQLGRLVIASLLKRVPAQQVVAAVRDVAKAQDLAALGVQVRHADYDDAASLDAAFDGARKVLLISSNQVGRRLPQHRNVIDAAARAKVALLAYTSILRADSSPLQLALEHRETEAAIRASGLASTFLRNSWYLENYTANLAPALAHGEMKGASGEGRVAAAARADYADAAVAVLLSETTPQAIYELGGELPFTRAQLAAEVARQSGKAVHYQNLPQAEYRAFLLSVGLPEGLANALADADAQTANGALDNAGDTLSKLIGRPATTLAAAVEAGLRQPAGAAH
ncbi:MAG: SDR family oxidoreductase [Pseudomonadota bacterium]